MNDNGAFCYEVFFNSVTDLQVRDTQLLPVVTAAFIIATIWDIHKTEFAQAYQPDIVMYMLLIQDIVNATTIASCFLENCTEECIEVSAPLVQTVYIAMYYQCVVIICLGTLELYTVRIN